MPVLTPFELWKESGRDYIQEIFRLRDRSGREFILPIKYDPKERKYHVHHDHLSPELGRRIVNDSLTLMRALGYDMCSLEWAIRGGVPYAIDFMNPAPDMDLYSLTPHYFQWAVSHMADMAIRLAKAPRAEVDLRRGEFLLGRRELAVGRRVEAAREIPVGTDLEEQPLQPRL